MLQYPLNVVASVILSKWKSIVNDVVVELVFNDRACLSCSETLPVEHLGGKALCMNQYYEVLSSCRIPGLKRDSVVNHAKSSRPPKHITVVHNFQVRSPTSCSELFWDQGPVSQSKFNLVWLSVVTWLHWAWH